MALVQALVVSQLAHIWSRNCSCGLSCLLALAKVCCLPSASKPRFRGSPQQWSLASLTDPNFSGLPQLCQTNPLRVSSWRQPQSSPWPLISEAWASVPNPYLPQSVCKHASQAGKCWLLLISVVNSLCFAFHSPVAVLHFEVSKGPLSTSLRVFPSVWKLFLLDSSLQRNRSLLNSSVLFFPCVFALPHYVEINMPFWKSGLSPTFSRCSVGAVPHADVFFVHLWGRR